MTKIWIQRAAATCVAAAILLTASTAWGEWGDGIKGGPFVVHPGLTLSMGFDSNLYYGSQREEGTVRRSPEGMLEPSLAIQTDDPGSWDLEGEASVGWRQYLTDDETVRSQSGLSAALDGSATWNDDGAFSVRLSEEFVRTNETPNYATATPFNRIFNKAGIMFGLHPGGRILETYASYDFSLYRHNLYSDLDRHTHDLGWSANWSFLPKTALVGEVDYRIIRYNQAVRGQDTVLNPEGRLRNVNSTPLRLLGGVEGLLTPRISLGLRGGYAWAFYEEGEDFSGMLARLTASYQFGRIDYDNRLRIGYRRDFSDSSVGNFFTSHRAIAGYEQGFLGDELRLDLEVDAQIRDYAELGVDMAQTESAEVFYPDELNDLLLGITASVDYEIRNGWNVGARYNFRSNFTDDEIRVEGPGQDSIRDYQRHHGLLTTTLRY